MVSSIAQSPAPEPLVSAPNARNQAVPIPSAPATAVQNASISISPRPSEPTPIVAPQHTPLPDGPPVSRNDVIDAQISDLEPVLRNSPASVKHSLRSILAMLSDLQTAMERSKFHLLLETDDAPSENRRTMTELRVIFSPTIDSTSPGTANLLLRAVGFMGLVSKAAAPARDASSPVQSPRHPDNEDAHETATEPSDSIRLPPPDQLPTSSGNLNLFRSKPFPSWFPGKPHTDASSGSLIRVSPITYEKFRVIPDNTITWMYEFFFAQATFAASQKYPHKKFAGVYSQFTADWYKGDFSVGPNNIYIMGITEVSQRRYLRNKDGRERMRLTLAAFYDHEPAFCSDAFNYILEHREILKQRYPFSKRLASRHRARRRRLRDQQRVEVAETDSRVANSPPLQPRMSDNDIEIDASDPVITGEHRNVSPPSLQRGDTDLVPGVVEDPHASDMDAQDDHASDSAYESGVEIGM